MMYQKIILLVTLSYTVIALGITTIVYLLKQRKRNNTIKTINRKGRPLFVKEMRVGDLDKSKCSPKFLSHNFDDEIIVNIKCYENGEIDLRGKKAEYRIIVPDKN